MGKNPDVIEAAYVVLHLMKAGMAIYGYPAIAIRGCGRFLGDNHAAIPWL